MNRYSAIAKQIMLAGLAKHTCAVPLEMQMMAEDMFNVPECPMEDTKFKYHRGCTIAVPVTGGLDSTVLYLRATEEVYQRRFRDGSDVVDFWMVAPYYVYFGQPYAAKETIAIESFTMPGTHILLGHGKIADETKYWKHIIPGRNLYVLSLIAEHMQGGEIWFGAVDGEMPLTGGDKSRYFIGAVNRLFSKLPYPVTVETPLEKETKTDLVKWWLDNGYSKEMLDKTVSCFHPEEQHCGACQACLRKWIAYTNNGLTLETTVPVKKGCVEFITKYRNLMGTAVRDRNFMHYSERRCIQTLAALEKL